MSQESKPNNFIIRDYRQDDFEKIIQLWKITDMGDPKRGDDKKTIENTIRLGGALLIMEEKSSGRICGTSWMTFDGRRIHLHHFGILPEFRRKGLATLLLNESLKFVKGKRCQVKLEVQRSNSQAINLYKKAGFSYLGDYDVYIIRDVD